MRTTTVTGLLTSPLLAMAAPAWTLWASNASVPAIHNKPINADSGSFYLNKPASAVCPDYAPNCPAQNTTIISGPVYGNNQLANTQYWFMGVLEEGGQQVDIAGFDSTNGGLPLKYAAAHAAEIGRAVWDVARNSHTNLIMDNSTVSALGAPTIRAAPSVEPYTWEACPDNAESDLSQPLRLRTTALSRAVSPGCVRLEITLRLTTLPAPQFYYCEGCEWRCDAIYGQSECRHEAQPACYPPYCGDYTDESEHVQ